MKLKTLIIDDDPSAISLLREMLGDHCECFVATNGQKGVELFEHAQKNRTPFEIVLLDIIMPDLNGVDVLQMIRKIELSHHPEPEIELYNVENAGKKRGRFARIIMQTSSEDPHDFLKSYRDGKCNGFINKPYSKDEIIKKVLGHVDYLDAILGL